MHLQQSLPSFLMGDNICFDYAIVTAVFRVVWPEQGNEIFSICLQSKSETEGLGTIQTNSTGD